MTSVRRSSLSVPVMGICRADDLLAEARRARTVGGFIGGSWFLAGQGKSGGSLAAPAVVSHPKALIWAAADWRDVLALGAAGCS
jgi:hypothetical protein